MDKLDAVMICEGAMPPRDEKEYLQAWQLLVDTGMAWKLQGSFGRCAEKLIQSGHIEGRNNGESTPDTLQV